MVIPNSFFARDTVQVARELVGQRLVRIDGSRRISGIILETEAYRGEDDLACHARAGMTPRTEVMYGPPGIAYVYLIYGLHWLLNVVTEPAGYPGAVLIRSLYPEEGQDLIASRRPGQNPRDWTNGPGKITQALEITGKHHGKDICLDTGDFFFERIITNVPEKLQAAPRIGLGSVPEPWQSIPWRFMVQYQHLGPEIEREE